MRKIYALLLFCITGLYAFQVNAENQTRTLNIAVSKNQITIEQEKHGVVIKGCVMISEVLELFTRDLQLNVSNLSIEARRDLLDYHLEQRYHIEKTRNTFVSVWFDLNDPDGNTAGLIFDFQGDRKADVMIVMQSKSSLTLCDKKYDM